MATTPNTLSPLPSRTDGLGIFPSGDSLNRTSVSSYGHTRSSTCTVLSYAQQFDQEKTPSPSSLTRTTTIRANLKEIQKSPLPHRFNLVPSSRKRVPEQPSKIPRSTTTQWPQSRGQGDAISGYATRSPSLYAISPKPQSPEERNEEKRTVLEDLLSDALDSPVFDCIPSFSPPCTPSPRTQMVSPPSFTLVQDQTSHKSRQSSTTPDSMSELQTSGHSRHPSMDRLPPAFPPPLPSPPVVTPRNKTHLYEDFSQASPTTPQDVFDAYPEDATPQSARTSNLKRYSRHPKSWQTGSSASSSSSRDFFASGAPDTSGSAYSQTSLHNVFEPALDHGNQFQAASRRATHGSFASLSSSDSRRRKFAVRRQAIYAEYGFKLAFPESDSSSSIRHTHIPTGSSRDFAEAGPSARAASAYAGSRSVWSASTSAASIRSQLQHEEDSGDEDEDQRGTEHLSLTYPSTRSLASLSNVERFSVQDAFLSSSRNPLLEDYAELMTSTPPAKPRSQTQHPVPLLNPLPEVGTPRTNLGGRPRPRTLTDGHVYACGLEWPPWPPLRLWGTDPENGNAIVRRSSSTLERAQMFAKWQDDPGHHPIVQELLDDVDLAIREWNHDLPVISEYI